MPDLSFNLDEKAVAKAVTDALATSIVSDVIRNVLHGRGINRPDIERQFDNAVQKAAYDFFLNALKEDPKFKAELKKHLVDKMSEDLVRNAIKHIEQRFPY